WTQPQPHTRTCLCAGDSNAAASVDEHGSCRLDSWLSPDRRLLGTCPPPPQCPRLGHRTPANQSATLIDCSHERMRRVRGALTENLCDVDDQIIAIGGPTRLTKHAVATRRRDRNAE